jgi:hypothetical protein
MHLLEVLQREHPILLASLPSTLCLLALSSFGALGPQWLTLRALRRAEPAEALSREAARALPRLGALGALTWLARGVLMMATLAGAATISSFFSTARDERVPHLGLVGAIALGGLAWLALSVWHDVASAIVVERDLGMARASALSFGAVRRRALQLVSSYAAVGLGTLTVVIGCGMLIGELDVAREGRWRGVLSLLVHQLAVVAGILLRTYWLSCAVSAAAQAGQMSKSTPD